MSASGGSTGSGGSNASGGASGTGTGGAPTTGTGGTTVTGTGGRNDTGGNSGSGGKGGNGGTAGAGAASAGGTTGGGGGQISPPSGGSGGHSASGGAAGGATGTAGAGGGSATPSAGCGKTRTLQNGTITIQSGGSRNYILRTPDSYDDTHPYRLVIAYAWSGASSSQVASSNYFTFFTQDNKNTIFVAPNASDGAGTWSSTDVTFTDAILAQVEGDLCIDKSHVFATGFSFGGAMATAIGCNRADVFRAVAFFSGADLTNSCPTTLTKPIAFYASQASEDRGSLPADSPIAGEVVQAKFAAVNGCTAQPASTTFPASGQPHTCTIYSGCSAGHPTEYCVFNGPHGWEPVDPGQKTSWNAPEAWKFITQF
jgi:poly(3-hydroxybutyrate) depolymerase